MHNFKYLRTLKCRLCSHTGFGLWAYIRSYSMLVHNAHMYSNYKLSVIFIQKQLDERVNELTAELKMKQNEIRRLKEDNKLLSKKISERKVMHLKKPADKVCTYLHTYTS